MLSDPPPSFFDRSPGPRVDWFVLEKPLDVVCKLTGGWIAIVRFLSQTLGADCFEIARDVRLQARHGDWLAMKHLQYGFEKRFAFEGRPASEQFIKNGA